ncbi:MAG TPA: beta-galactosidase [Candidatus Sulfotelmatobacter sp.]|nr:beta-galactosidase [Candidatus Sulfotelmatobacter sp.]
MSLIAASGLRLPIWRRALHAVLTPESSGERPLFFGVDYYPDQTPDSLWEEDARMISEAGLTNVRVAEFAWSLMEPSEGQFDFAWLKRSVGILHKHGIAVILGTPSAAPPPWLTEKYPEVLMVNSEGMTVNPGARRFTCPSNKTYRRLSLTIATEMAKNFADTPGVIGWQIDNEFTLQPFGRCYCKYCREGFQDWARQKYGSLDGLNHKWGTAFWSQIYTDWKQIPVPLPSNAPPNPGLALDYDRYQSFANASFAAEQVEMLRKQCPNHFLTTNSVGAPFDTLNLRELFRDLDFVSDDNYPGFAAMFMPGEITPEKLAISSAIGHDSMRSVKGGKPYLIMEEQSGKAGQQSFSPQPHPGQLRLWAFQAVAHGAMGVNYFRWDTARFGAEEYWHGLLNHDRSKSPGFDEIIATVKDMKALGREILESSYVAENALSFDQDCDWAVQIQPGHAKLTYRDQLMKWYGAIAGANAGTDLIHLDEDLSKYKAVFAPLQYVLTQKQADNIKSYVHNGGMFVAGFRLGVKDENSQIVNMPLPGLLREVMGVTLKDYVPIYSEKVGVDFESQLGGPEGNCGLWADLLAPDTASTLAKYTGPYAGAAITINNFGKGKAVYVGADLDPESLARVLRTFLMLSGSKSDFSIPNGLELTRRRAGQKQWFFLLNHAAESKKINLSGKFKAVLGNSSVDGTLELKPYEVAILQRA